MKKSVYLCIITLWLIGNCSAQADNKVSGIYEDFIVGVDDHGILTGWLEIYRGENSQFSCVFYLSGRLKEKEEFDIVSWYPGDNEPPIKGKAKQIDKDGKRTLSIRLESEPSGCRQCYPGGLTEWSNFAQISAGDWKAIRIVSSGKAFFYQKPDAKTKQKAYIIRYNPLMVYENNNGFVNAKFRNEKGKITSGWIKLSDLFSDVQPPI